MSDKEVTDKAIDDRLEIMMDESPNNEIRLLAKLIFNVRFDLNEMKLELLKVFKDECEEVKHKKEEEDGRFYT